MISIGGYNACLDIIMLINVGRTFDAPFIGGAIIKEMS